ncbi:Complex 1 LYR protein [Plasmopara halstedii]|uniref:Complex 1 LYR protein n=1 Tax=Plasmopara halstedii TaxID=4781 RepID=A0A0P1AV53_PLAHL|nr:Complex 1 LYR protein [Plasmopara halstedii]CEG46297.1 Complex 1 LYR protein [Plasmopara halstedii]|eukprot:XP_024582666.1 Complex 1 LYR protein [Plasmopara halstedii]
MRRALGSEIKSLQYFLNRTVVLKQYREFLRITKPLEIDVRMDVRRQIREGFEAYRDEEDEGHTRLLLRQAREQLKMVSELVDTAQAQQRSESRSRLKKKAIENLSCTTDTWMDTPSKDVDGTEDIKGRLGTGWPWKSENRTNKFDLKGIKRR